MYQPRSLQMIGANTSKLLVIGMPGQTRRIILEPIASVWVVLAILCVTILFAPAPDEDAKLCYGGCQPSEVSPIFRKSFCSRWRLSFISRAQKLFLF